MTGRLILSLIMGWACLVGCACSKELVSGLGEREANEVMLVLAGADLDAEKLSVSGEITGWSVRVGQSDAGRAYALLQAAGLPRPKREGFQSVYRERGLVPGRLEERALYISALQEEIAATLESVPGVVSARVHATIGSEKRRLRGVPPEPNTAAVLISYVPTGEGLPPLTGQDVRTLVAHAVDGLTADRVAVVFSARHVPAPGAVVRPQAEGWPGFGARALTMALALLALLGGLVSLVWRRRGRLGREGLLRP